MKIVLKTTKLSYLYTIIKMKHKEKSLDLTELEPVTIPKQGHVSHELVKCQTGCLVLLLLQAV